MRLLLGLLLILSVASSYVFATDDFPLKQPVQRALINKATALYALPDKKLDNALFDLKNMVAINEADRYLMLVITGGDYINRKQYHQAITYFKRSETIANAIHKDQLVTDHFRVKNLLMSYAYLQIEDFDKAYEQKREYLFKFLDNEAIEAEQQALELEKKYQIEQIAEQEKLLQQQRAWQQLQLEKVKVRTVEHERNNIIIGLFSLIFILLLLRQFTISQRLKRLSRIDDLTQLYNNTYLYKLGTNLYKQMTSNQRSFSAMYIDVNNFGRINSQLGLAAGDKVLKNLAKMLKEVMRARDILARIDGGKFVILLPEVSLIEAKAIASRIEKKMCHVGDDIVAEPLNVTANIGVASYNEQINNIDELIQLAYCASWQD